MLTDTEWEKIEKKYGKLMYTISHRISGDTATSSFEDNLQDIRLTAMEAVAGFEKQNDGANGTFKDFWGTPGFDKYIKTCMWTKKNNKGAKITKKSPILKGTVSTEREEVLDIEANSGNPETSIFLKEVLKNMTRVQSDIVNLVVKDPSLIKPSGKINVKKVSELLNLSWFEVDKQVKSLSKAMENPL